MAEEVSLVRARLECGASLPCWVLPAVGAPGSGGVEVLATRGRAGDCLFFPLLGNPLLGESLSSWPCSLFSVAAPLLSNQGGQPGGEVRLQLLHFFRLKSYWDHWAGV